MTDATRAALPLGLDQWDLIIDALQAVADDAEDDLNGQQFSDLAVLLRNGVDRLVPGTYGGCEDIPVTGDEAALLPAPEPGPQPEPEPVPPLPPGEYARVEIMGHDSEYGWVTERTRAGVLVMVVSDWDGRVKAEIPGQSLYKFVPLPTPQKRPEPPKAITAPDPWSRYIDQVDDDEEPDGHGAHVPDCHDPECDGECLERTPS